MCQLLIAVVPLFLWTSRVRHTHTLSFLCLAKFVAVPYKESCLKLWASVHTWRVSNRLCSLHMVNWNKINLLHQSLFGCAYWWDYCKREPLCDPFEWSICLCAYKRICLQNCLSKLLLNILLFVILFILLSRSRVTINCHSASDIKCATEWTPIQHHGSRSNAVARPILRLALNRSPPMSIRLWKRLGNTR